MTTLEIQRRLRALGHNPGPADGIRGRLTIGAIKAFQIKSGLVPDGIVGPLTMAALFGARLSATEKSTAVIAAGTPWYSEATRLMGLKEGRGAADNPEIMDWADDLDLHYPSDATAWCGLFVGHCIASQLPEEALPTNPLGARNWSRFGQPVTPRIGAVLSFWRGSPQGWQGHTGFCAGERPDAFLVRGGNQSDSVSDAWVAKSRLLRDGSR